MRSVARRVRPQAESILHDPPIQRKAPFGAFFVSVTPHPNLLLSRFNTASIGISLFSERHTPHQDIIRRDLRGQCLCF